ncbi:hypothetical protein DL546_000483 [Coniochaeta pulveracea]|uniref:Mitochondrial carrier protein n=1 Tax=Coniochaeta pulveracea TaxID=177199 RepID=A0A420Y188_9PEZI|nr:hypothetical protein DL546_000483 [Coniochaeta pulveracea]
MTNSDGSGRNTFGTFNSSLWPSGPGILPALPPDAAADTRDPSSNAATGASAAGVRALTSQAVAFYFRAPVKAFFRTRVDYLAYARVLQEQQAALRNAVLHSSSHASSPSIFPWLRNILRSSTPGLVASAVRYYGWRVVPEQVLPPLIANVGAGAVLYTSYLQILGHLHEGSGKASKRVYPPPQPIDTFTAGFLAGALQSVLAAPLDAVQARYDSGAVGLNGRGGATASGSGNGQAVKVPASRPQSWSLSFLKDTMGNAIFFSTFEYLKAQGYYHFVTWYYGSLNEDTIVLLSEKRPSGPDAGKVRKGDEERRMPAIIKPHYAIEPSFLLLAGVSASVAQQVVLHPLTHIQVEHWERLEKIDAEARKIEAQLKPGEKGRWMMFRTYYNAYQETYAHCVSEAESAGLSMRKWLYRGFWWNTIRQVPSTSAGLIIFELVRRKYGFGGDQVRINKDGYDILLR